MRFGNTIYADYQAATPIDPRVSAVMAEAEQTLFANPLSADHAAGWAAARSISDARCHVSDLLNVFPEDIRFTSGATAANDIALRLARGLADTGPRRGLIVGAGDHNSVLSGSQSSGLDVLRWPLRSCGAPDLDWLNAERLAKTAMVSVIGVNNETGVPSPLIEIAARCAAAKVPLHVDAAQMPLAMGFDPASLGASLATISSHKIYGPKGVGALYIGPDMIKTAQSFHLDGDAIRGTPPTALLAGFGEACRLVDLEGDNERMSVARLRDRFVSLLQSTVGTVLVGTRVGRHPGNALLHIPSVSGADLLSRCQPDIAASTQSACRSEELEPSLVVQAMGYTQAFAENCVRFSFGRFTDVDQINELAEIVSEACIKIRSESL